MTGITCVPVGNTWPQNLFLPMGSLQVQRNRHWFGDYQTQILVPQRAPCKYTDIEADWKTPRRTASPTVVLLLFWHLSCQWAPYKYSELEVNLLEAHTHCFLCCSVFLWNEYKHMKYSKKTYWCMFWRIISLCFTQTVIMISGWWILPPFEIDTKTEAYNTELVYVQFWL